jgi:hypothetical protein
LQLPLYRLLTEELRAQRPGETVLGYVLLDKQARGAVWSPLELDEAGYQDALSRAREIVELVRAGRFEPSADFESRDELLAELCGATATREDFEQELLEDGEDFA